ncbi:hypothetical protein [Streptomonospora salina]|uniref:Uncharacterized protein n=1 Tax=Streptomonospora salina TaxID=104205 RepID=A0A841EAG6_9ACTN|nr:hypothetical protein [Streptomonospora salina]MBB5998058.1 hypothetical protein [Streptomonospora salina]
MDHTTRWTRDGEPALLLTQPYGSPETLRESIGWLLEDDAFYVAMEPSWYGHGTTGIFVWRSDVWQSLQED